VNGTDRHDHLDESAVDPDVLAALAELAAEQPSASLRSAVAASVATRPRPAMEPLPVVDVYTARVAALDALLDELDEPDWLRVAPPYAWSVHELVAHLTLIEEYTVRQLGLGDEAPAPVGDDSVSDHLALGAGEIAAMVARPPTVTAERWRRATRIVLGHVRSEHFDASQPVPLHAWPFDASTALVARSFELWTHADDIRRAAGREPDVPSPAELRTMSSTSVRGLPTLFALAGGGALRPTRVVLTGPGGGTFDLASTGAVADDDRQLLVVDVVDYCRLVARRLHPDDITGTREGDGAVLTDLLRSAQAIAI
jgi:uncharacterized protein (TIGR03083 family)